jgi:hypothetical protein
VVTTCNKQHGDPSERPAAATRRRAVTSFEVLVAFSLVATVIGMSAPLIVRHGRLLATARHYRLAVEELTNQLERVAALPPADIDEAVSSINVSDFTAEKLPGAELTAELHDAEFGRRVTLHIVWDEPQRRETPLTMTAWVAPDDRTRAERPRDAAAEEEQP